MEKHLHAIIEARKSAKALSKRKKKIHEQFVAIRVKNKTYNCHVIEHIIVHECICGDLWICDGGASRKSDKI